jgi:hypothetical protein
MRLASVDLTNEKTVYTYQCANGHQRQFSTTDPTSISGLPTTDSRTIATEPSEIFSGAWNNLMIYLGACCGTGPKPSFQRCKRWTLVQQATVVLTV